MSQSEPSSTDPKTSQRHGHLTGSAERARLVVHPPRYLPLSAEERAHAVAALRALLVPYLRRQRTSQGQPATPDLTSPPGRALLLLDRKRSTPGDSPCQPEPDATHRRDPA